MQAWGNSEDDPRWASWKKAMAEDGVAASRYAIEGKLKNMEDFAETWLLYTKSRGARTEPELREIFGARFREIDALLASRNGRR